MNLADCAIKNRVVMHMVTLLLIVGGIWAYQQMPRLEDPEFTIKQALVQTEYPGATPEEVALEVTDKLETAIQQLGQLDTITSQSRSGLSIITVEIKNQYNKTTLPQVWDELRRKVNDAQRGLPPGTRPSRVIDDFGDVYGVYFALTGEGFTYQKLYEFAKDLRRELLLAKDVAKVELWGVQQETVYVEMSRSRMAGLGVSQQDIFNTLKQQNMVMPSGWVQVDKERVRINPTGMHENVEEIGNLLVRASKTGELIYLKDVATVQRGYIDPPRTLMRYNGERAIGIGISTISGGNVVTMGEAVSKRLEELRATMPLGMEISRVYYQPKLVTEAVNGFLNSLLQALAIVIGTLMIVMGLRSGFLVGAILLLTISGTMIFMYIWGVALERVSLGALIIALGMLVDNAIVVVEGILIGVQRGMKSTEAAIQVVKQTSMPLLGSTAVAIFAFTGIGLSNDSTGEYCYSLFQVILISLSLSWFLAVTLTPLYGAMFIKAAPALSGAEDPYSGRMYQTYKRFLLRCLWLKWITVGVLVALLAGAVYGFGFIQGQFFPDSTLNMFYADYWAPEGTHIEETAKDMEEAREYISKLSGVKSVTSIVGQGSLRFMLTYQPEKLNPSYGQLIIEVDEFQQVGKLIPTVEDYLSKNFDSAEPRVQRFVFGPGGGFSIEARFRGPDPVVLRGLSNQAKAIMEADPNTKYVRDDWRGKVKLLVPEFSEARARRAGIARPDLSQALEMNFSGLNVGLYREEDELLPIILRPPDAQRIGVDNIHDVQVWSPVNQRFIPINQTVSGFLTQWVNSIVRRRDRLPTVTAQCDPKEGLAEPVFNRLRPKIEAIKLPPGYELEWGGEHDNVEKAHEQLATVLPFSFLAMIITIIVMFNSVRRPLIIFLTVPLAIVGVTVGLLATGQPFGFMALLGFLSLTGILIKNAVVLIDQIVIEIEEGKEVSAAIVDSAVSRMRPVTMGAFTTILGMIPLLKDTFFVAMAVTMMSGLAFATAMTLIAVPVLYAIFYRVPYREV